MIEDSRAYQSFQKSPFSSIKHTSYFQVYDELFGPYVGKPITFVEVGVLNGGSLFMWREFFGPQARIIGVELNPLAKKWEEHGFEIHTGSQADPDFWKQFFAKVGPVDILLDDGGHFHDQQIITTVEAIPHIKDGGLLVVEDVHTSYMPKFNSPSRYSFINFAKSIADRINARFPGLDISTQELGKNVFSVAFYESIVSMKIDRRKCFTAAPIKNAGETAHAKDFRKIDQKKRMGFNRLMTKLAYKMHFSSFSRCLVAVPINNWVNRGLKRFF